jgi:hypothetical protein
MSNMGSICFLTLPWGGSLVLRVFWNDGSLDYICLERRGPKDFTFSQYKIGDLIQVPDKLPTLSRQERKYVEFTLSDVDPESFEEFEE